MAQDAEIRVKELSPKHRDEDVQHQTDTPRALLPSPMRRGRHAVRSSPLEGHGEPLPPRIPASNRMGSNSVVATPADFD